MLRRQGDQHVPFADFLDAKYALDDRSLNADVRQVMIAELASRPHLNCLDLGTGTGAVVRRLLDWFPESDLVVTALDCDRQVLDIAHRRIADELHSRDFRVEDHGSRISGRSGTRQVGIEFVCCRAAAFGAVEGRFQLVTAHAFADLVPTESLVTQLGRWVAPEGCVYATLNYDSGTFLFPSIEADAFERAILAHYDGSMEARRVEGRSVGGARSGSRLMTALASRGWIMQAYGSSDWNLTPVRGVYRERDAVCLKAMLDFISGEAGKASFDRTELDHWREQRLKQLADRTLGMIVHHVDVFATKPGSN